jgi:hypothetical protein
MLHSFCLVVVHYAYGLIVCSCISRIFLDAYAILGGRSGCFSWTNEGAAAGGEITYVLWAGCDCIQCRGLLLNSPFSTLGP